MTEPGKIPDGVAIPLPGARTTHRAADRDKVRMQVALPGCSEPLTLVEAASCCSLICNAGDLQMLGIAIYQDGKAVGLLHLFTCEEARMLAESLVSMAATLENAAAAEAAQKIAAIRAAGKGGAA